MFTHLEQKLPHLGQFWGILLETVEVIFGQDEEPLFPSETDFNFITINITILVIVITIVIVIIISIIIVIFIVIIPDSWSSISSTLSIDLLHTAHAKTHWSRKSIPFSIFNFRFNFPPDRSTTAHDALGRRSSFVWIKYFSKDWLRYFFKDWARYFLSITSSFFHRTRHHHHHHHHHNHHHHNHHHHRTLRKVYLFDARGDPFSPGIKSQMWWFWWGGGWFVMTWSNYNDDDYFDDEWW